VLRVESFILLLLLAASLTAQKLPKNAVPDVQPLIDTERQFESVAGAKGVKAAYLQFLAPDSTIFRPDPVNGQKFWQASSDPASLLLSRNITYADIASNGILGYTTGNWRLYERGKSESYARFGQYVTIWEKKPDGKYQATIDIGISHDKLPFSETDKPMKWEQTRDANKRGRSPADASMRFTRLGMAPKALGGAFEEYAAEDIRLLIDDLPPILGRGKATEVTKHYLSVRFPEKIVLYQAADMAYTWNPCQFANSKEGMEQGNCLQIWKLRGKKWWIVLSVFAKVPVTAPPTLKDKAKKVAEKP
jgi:ketosteroid isomerase-like protein